MRYLVTLVLAAMFVPALPVVIPAPDLAAGFSATAASTLGTRELHRGRIVLDYPASWRAQSMLVSTLAGTTLALLGTSQATAGCIGVPATCGVFYNLTAGTVEMSIGYPRFSLAPGSYLSPPLHGATYLSIDGVPGVYS